MELFDILDKIKLLKCDIDELNTICTSDNYEILCKIIDARATIKTISQHLEHFRPNKEVERNGLMSIVLHNNLSNVNYDIKKLIDLISHINYIYWENKDKRYTRSGVYIEIKEEHCLCLLKNYNAIMAYTENDYEEMIEFLCAIEAGELIEEVTEEAFEEKPIEEQTLIIGAGKMKTIKCETNNYYTVTIDNYHDGYHKIIKNYVYVSFRTPYRHVHLGDFIVNINEFNNFMGKIKLYDDVYNIEYFDVCASISKSTAWKKFIGINKIFDNVQALKLFHLHIDKKIELQKIYEKYGTDIQIINNLNSQYKKKQNSIMAIDNI